jgi:Tfp pilus assembly protein PilV
MRLPEPTSAPGAGFPRVDPQLGSSPARNRRGAWAAARRRVAAFTLIEVMIACGIFFMATFAILALVANSLRNARALQRGDVDAGMAAAQIFQMLKTNRQADITGSGDFGDSYPDYSYEFASSEYMTNGLLQVDITVNKRGLQKPYDTLSIWVYSPDAKSGPSALNLH